MTVWYFDGTSLPPDWSSIEPSQGHVVVNNGYLAFQSDAGADFDSLSGTVTVPEGPRVLSNVSGSFDYAVGLASAVNCANGQGIDLLAMDEANGWGIRFAQYIGSIGGRSSSWFGYRRDSGTAGNLSMSNPPSNLWGPRSWMRLTFDDSTGAYSFYSSHTGKPGTWFEHISFTSVLIPVTFELTLTAFQPDSNGREVRAAVVVDMDGRSDDATSTDPGEDIDRIDLYSNDFSGGNIPPWITTQTANNGAVNSAPDGIDLVTDTGTLDSYAWVIGPDDLPLNHGIIFLCEFIQPSELNSFAAPTIRGATTTDLPASSVVPDKYRVGTGLLTEINGSGTFGDIIRTLTAHPVNIGTTYDGNLEFYGFSMMVEDQAAPVDGTVGPIWVQMETYRGYWRSRFWYDGDPQPSGWSYEGEDWTQRGSSINITWSHNDSTSGGLSTFRLRSLTIYELAQVTDQPTIFKGDGTPLRAYVKKSDILIPLVHHMGVN